MKNPPVVTLLTDFGHGDPFVGIMKGVILRLCPEASIVDLCHEVPAFHVLGAGFLLRSAARFFPAGTIHVAVVDPGVGGPRRPILARIDQQLFVAPDNGLLSYSMGEGRVKDIRLVSAREFLLEPVGATFHGRDVFAPVAGHLARGIPPDRFGPAILDAVRLEIPRAGRDASGRLVGEVLWVDRFGNCVTSISQEELAALAGGGGRAMRVILEGEPLGRVVSFFGEAGPGGRGAVLGSTGHLELFANLGNLAQERGVRPGARVAVEVEGDSGEARAESRELRA